MIAADVTPRLIGHVLRVEKRTGTVQGVLSDIRVETVEDTPLFASTQHVYLTSVVLQLGSKYVHLKGHEKVAIVATRTTQQQ